MDGVFTLKHVIEKRVEFNKEMHQGFVNHEKLFDKVC